MLREASVVYRKELVDTLRDRKTLVFMILLPLLLVPVLAGTFTRFVTEAEKDAATSTLRYTLVAQELAPPLGKALEDTPGMERIELDEDIDPIAAIEEERLDFVVELSPGPGGQVIAGLHYDNAPLISRVRKRFEAVVEQVNAGQRREALQALGVRDETAESAVLEPIAIKEHGTATQRELMGERMGGMLPYVFIVFCFLGALYPAIDLGATEKERGTLETLLLAPVQRSALVLGKFFVVFTTSLTATVLGTASLGVWLVTEGYGQKGPLGEVLSSIGPGELALIAALLLPIAAVLAALLLSISIYAKSFKEAQSYIGPLNILVILPAIVGTLPGIELDWRWAMVPVSNVALAIKEIIKGTVDPLMVGLILASSLILAAVMLVFCTRWFCRESVLFRR